MILQRFNVYKNWIEFDAPSGDWYEINKIEGVSTDGVGDIVAGTCVAMVQSETKSAVYVGDVVFDMNRAQVDLSYVHQSDGTTVFSAADSTKQARLIYPSWWLHCAPFPVAFGCPADDEADICAYIIDMMSRPYRDALQATLNHPDIKNKLKYYAFTPGDCSSPRGVFRFYTDNDRAPERYSAEHGWVADSQLALHFMSGDMDEADLIGVQEAVDIILLLQAAHRHNDRECAAHGANPPETLLPFGETGHMLAPGGKDRLTGALKRHAFFPFLHNEIERSGQASQPLVLMCADIDNMKHFNTHNGHQAGDRLLVKFVELANAQFDRRFPVFRLGGDLFAAVFHGITMDLARRIAYSLCSDAQISLAPPQAEHCGDPDCLGPAKISVSIGLAAWKKGDAPESLLHEAEELLHQAKASGRGKVCLSELPESRALALSSEDCPTNIEVLKFVRSHFVDLAVDRKRNVYLLGIPFDHGGGGHTRYYEMTKKEFDDCMTDEQNLTRFVRNGTYLGMQNLYWSDFGPDQDRI